MKRALTTACVGLVLMSGLALVCPGQGRGTHVSVRTALGSRPAGVEITPTTMAPGGTSIEIDDNRWSARGFDLKSLLSEIYNIDQKRIELPESVSPGPRSETPADAGDDERYDVSLALPRGADDDQVMRLLQSAVEHRFGVSIASEQRQMDVYVLTAPNGPGLALHRHVAPLVGRRVLEASEDGTAAGPGQITYSGRSCPGNFSGGISASAGTIAEFRRTLEPTLDRLLIDETRLQGSFDFNIESYTSEAELFRQMRDRLGLVATPAERSVTILAVRPTERMRAAL